MTNQNKDINWQIMLQHIQKAAKDTKKDLNEMEERMNKRFDKVDERLIQLGNGQNLLLEQTKNLSDGLDHVEVIEVPKVRKSIRNLQKRVRKIEQPVRGRATVAV